MADNTPAADNATFPYHNSSYTTFFIHALGYIYFSEAAALPLGTCTQHGHFFSADRIYAFCTGNGFVSNPSVSPLLLPVSLAKVVILTQGDTCQHLQGYACRPAMCQVQQPMAYVEALSEHALLWFTLPQRKAPLNHRARHL